MALKNLELTNFRIHKHTILELSANLNFIIGGNGQGKTSIIEAIYYLCTTKNYKSAGDVDVVRFGEDSCDIKATFHENTENKSRIFFSNKENKRSYFYNNKLLSRSADIIGNYPVVLLTPDDHFITQGYPAERRKFIDSIISQAYKIYLETLLDYNRTLKQKSRLLFLIREENSKRYLDELNAWNEKLVIAGSKLILYRNNFVEEYREYLFAAYKKILEEKEEPKIYYETFLENDFSNIEEKFHDKLKQLKQDEIKRAQNLCGPHKDDFVFFIDDINLKTYGSQGQHKTFQVALKFAQFFFLKEKMNKKPIFLLDDVFGELDTNRSISISKYLKEVGQAVITITDFSNYSFLSKEENDKMFIVNNGEVKLVS